MLGCDLCVCVSRTGVWPHPAPVCVRKAPCALASLLRAAQPTQCVCAAAQPQPLPVHRQPPFPALKNNKRSNSGPAKTRQSQQVLPRRLYVTALRTPQAQWHPYVTARWASPCHPKPRLIWLRRSIKTKAQQRHLYVTALSARGHPSQPMRCHRQTGR